MFVTIEKQQERKTRNGLQLKTGRKNSLTMEESFSTVSSMSSINAKSRKPESLYHCNRTSPSHEDHANMNMPLESELSCTYDKNSSSSQPKSDHSMKEQGNSVGLTEVSSYSDKNGSYGDNNNPMLDLDLTLWVNHVERKHTSPEPNDPMAEGIEQAKILTVRNFQVPEQSRQDNNVNIYSDSWNMVNAEERFKRTYHKSILGQPRPVQCSDSLTLKENQQDTLVIHLSLSTNTSRQSRSSATNHSEMVSVDGLCNLSQEKVGQLSSFDHNSTNTYYTAVGDSSTTKDEEVIGWPPVRAYRRNSLGSLPKPSGENQQGAVAGSFVQDHKNSLYVKVNMDGMPIGRKVDLNASESYEILARDLENMFQLTTENHIGACMPMGNRHVVEPLRLLDPAADFVLTYEDSEGDCMLIGDIPWKMFLHTVKRLRIMKNLGTNALAQKCSRKRKAI